MARTQPTTWPHSGVKLAGQSSAKGWRVWWTAPDGRRRDAFRSTRAEAHQLAQELDRLLLDEDPDRDTPRMEQPVDRLLDLYLDPATRLLEPWSPATQEIAEREVRLRIRPAVGHLAGKDWKAEHTRAMLDGMVREGHRPSTTGLTLKIVRQVVRLGREEGYLPLGRERRHDPALPGAKLKGDRASASTVDMGMVPDQESVLAYADVLGRLYGPMFSTAAMLAAHSGLRLGELLGLRVGRVDLDACTIEVREQLTKVGTWGPPKHGVIRTTFFPEELRPELEQLMAGADDGDLVFPAADGQPWTHHAWRHFTAKQRPTCDPRAMAGWPVGADGRYLWTWHSLRHYFCTWALSAPPRGPGLDVADVSQFAGHSSPDITLSMYVRAMPRAEERAVAAARSVSIRTHARQLRAV
jgi:integrase